MVKISVTYTRPSVSVPWHFEVIDMTAIDAMAGSEPWASKHQLISVADLVSPGSGSTELVASIIWNSQGDFEDFIATPESQSYVAARDVYNAQNGITKSDMVSTAV